MSGLIWILAVIVGTIFRVEIEEFWNDCVQPFLMETAWPQVAAMLDYIYSIWGAAALFVIIFASVSLTSHLARRWRKPPNQIGLPIDPDWRAAYLNRPTLRIWEAACVFAGVLPQKPIPLGVASSYVEEFKDAVRRKKITAIDTRPVTMATMAALDIQREMESREHIINTLSDETVIVTASAKSYMERKLKEVPM